MKFWKQGCLLGLSIVGVPNFAHAVKWFCPECQKDHETDLCPRRIYVRDFYWWCKECRAIHVPGQVWPVDNREDPYGREDPYSCTNDCFPCSTCDAVHDRYTIYRENRWCCKRCHRTHVLNEICPYGSWWCEVHNRPHVIEFDCPYCWYCTNCKTHHQVKICSKQKQLEHSQWRTLQWYCWDCHKSYQAGKGCQHNWWCGICSDTHEQLNQPFCENSWYCKECKIGHLFAENCPRGYWFCKECKLAIKKEVACSHQKWCETCHQSHPKDAPCPLEQKLSQSQSSKNKKSDKKKHSNQKKEDSNSKEVIKKKKEKKSVKKLSSSKYQQENLEINFPISKIEKKEEIVPAKKTFEKISISKEKNVLSFQPNKKKEKKNVIPSKQNELLIKPLVKENKGKKIIPDQNNKLTINLAPKSKKKKDLALHIMIMEIIYLLRRKNLPLPQKMSFPSKTFLILSHQHPKTKSLLR